MILSIEEQFDLDEKIKQIGVQRGQKLIPAIYMGNGFENDLYQAVNRDIADEENALWVSYDVAMALCANPHIDLDTFPFHTYIQFYFSMTEAESESRLCDFDEFRNSVDMYSTTYRIVGDGIKSRSRHYIGKIQDSIDPFYIVPMKISDIMDWLDDNTYKNLPEEIVDDDITYRYIGSVDEELIFVSPDVPDEVYLVFSKYEVLDKCGNSMCILEDIFPSEKEALEYVNDYI